MRRFLLDTQAFILAAQAEGALSDKAGDIILNPQSELYLSVVSLWEMQIKMSIGKLKLPVSLREAVQKAVTEIGLEILPLLIDPIYRLETLPFHHRDPFDRLLIAQALHERIPIISSESTFDNYKVERIW